MAKRSNPLPSEKEIERMILQWLDLQSTVFCWKQNTTGIYDPTKGKFRALRGFAKVGISDILMVTLPAGKFGAIEVKTPAGAVTHNRKYGFPCTPEQNYFLERVRAYGGFGGVATSLEDAAKICRGHI